MKNDQQIPLLNDEMFNRLAFVYCSVGPLDNSILYSDIKDIFLAPWKLNCNKQKFAIHLKPICHVLAFWLAYVSKERNRKEPIVTFWVRFTVDRVDNKWWTQLCEAIE